MMNTRRTTAAIVTGMAAAVLLAGCTGDAQNPNGAEQPNDSARALPNGSQCDHSSKNTATKLKSAVDSGVDIVLVDIVKDGDSWYLATNVGGSETDASGDPFIGVWGTSSNPKAESFDGSFVPLNKVARQYTSGSASGSDFSSSSSAAKRVKACAVIDAVMTQ